MKMENQETMKKSLLNSSLKKNLFVDIMNKVPVDIVNKIQLILVKITMSKLVIKNITTLKKISKGKQIFFINFIFNII